MLTCPLAIDKELKIGHDAVKYKYDSVLQHPGGDGEQFHIGAYHGCLLVAEVA